MRFTKRNSTRIDKNVPEASCTLCGTHARPFIKKRNSAGVEDTQAAGQMGKAAAAGQKVAARKQELSLYAWEQLQYAIVLI